jgi:hypothetical protein
LPTNGTFHKKVTVTIIDTTAGATIHYTTDGSDPTTSSPVYGHSSKKTKKGGSEIILTGRGQHTVKAMATAPGFEESAIATATYTIN